MSVQETTSPNIKVFETFVDAWNSNNLSKIMTILDVDFKAEGTAMPMPLNAEQYMAYNQNFLTAFPGSKFENTLFITQGDYVVVHWKVTGTNSGPLQSPSGAVIPPTGKSGVTYGSSTALVKDGKIVHSWTYFDMAALLTQLGLLPPM